VKFNIAIFLRSYSQLNPRGHQGVTDGDVVKIVVPHFLFIFDLTTGGINMH
jgi:hypothetical protein